MANKYRESHNPELAALRKDMQLLGINVGPEGVNSKALKEYLLADAEHSTGNIDEDIQTALQIMKRTEQPMPVSYAPQPTAYSQSSYYAQPVQSVAKPAHHALTATDLNEAYAEQYAHDANSATPVKPVTGGMLPVQAGTPGGMSGALLAAQQVAPIQVTSATGAFSTPSQRQYPGTQRLTSLDAAQITQESGWNPNIVSPKGCIGLMQVQPATGIEWAHTLGIKAADGNPADQTNITEILNDPAKNVHIGHAYQQYLIKKAHGNVPVAMAAYNGGEGRVFGYTDKRTGKHNPGWLETIGDPSKGEISNADWVEKIPIEETKKYAGNVPSLAQRNEEATLAYEAAHPHHTPKVKPVHHAEHGKPPQHHAVHGRE